MGGGTFLVVGSGICPSLTWLPARRVGISPLCIWVVQKQGDPRQPIHMQASTTEQLR